MVSCSIIWLVSRQPIWHEAKIIVDWQFEFGDHLLIIHDRLGLIQESTQFSPLLTCEWVGWQTYSCILNGKSNSPIEIWLPLMLGLGFRSPFLAGEGVIRTKSWLRWAQSRFYVSLSAWKRLPSGAWIGPINLRQMLPWWTKINRISLVSEILSQKLYQCVQYTNHHQISLISHFQHNFCQCWLIWACYLFLRRPALQAISRMNNMLKWPTLWEIVLAKWN